RSESLLSSLLPLIGEFQLLAWTDESNGIINDLNQAAIRTADAIDRADPEDASQAARKHIQILARHISHERSRLFAVSPNSKNLTPKDAFYDVLDHVRQIQTSLQQARLQFEALQAPQYARAKPAERIDQLVKDIALRNKTLLRGAGIAYAPGMLQDTHLWIDWWDAGESLDLTFKSHDFNSQALQYYDYQHMPWFSQPLQTGKFSVVGPYLDRGGIETSTITVSTPITNGSFAGRVLGADLHIPSIEQFLLKNSSTIGHGHILVNKTKRVLVSTDPTIMHSSILKPKQESQYSLVAQEETNI